MNRRLNRILVLCLAVIGVLALALAALQMRRRATNPSATRGPSTPEELVESTRRAGDLDTFLKDFARAATNSATIMQWKSWAATKCEQAAGKAHDSSFFDGVALKKEELPQFLPHADGLVEAAVLRTQGTNSYVKICLRGRDCFYGILVGTNASLPIEIDSKIQKLHEGFLVYLTKAY